MSRPIPVEEIARQFKSRHATAHLFKIDDFSLMEKHQIEYVNFVVDIGGGQTWKLSVYPHGFADKKNYVSIFLQGKDTLEGKLRCEVFVINQLEQKWHSSGILYPNFMRMGVLIEEFIPFADLEKKGYLIGDCCMFGVKFFGIKHVESVMKCLSLIEKPLNHKVTWMIPKFSSLDPEKVHSSKGFVVGDRKWRIQVHPRKYMGNETYLSIHLLGEGFIKNAVQADTLAKFKLRVLDQVNQDHVEDTKFHVFTTEPGKTNGFDRFMPLKKLGEPYLLNDKLYVGVEFQLISTTNYC